MPIRFLADENISLTLVRALKRRCPDVDILRIQDVGLMSADDAAILQWAADANRIVLSRDVHTMTVFASQRIQREEKFTGLILLSKASLSDVLDDLELITQCCVNEEFINRIEYLPLQP